MNVITYHCCGLEVGRHAKRCNNYKKEKVINRSYFQTYDIMVCNAQNTFNSINLERQGWTRVYIGRPSPFGNSFPMTVDTEFERQQVIDKFERWFNIVLEQKDLKHSTYKEFTKLVDMYKSGQKILLECWCVSKSCHREVIMRKMIEWIEKDND